MRKYRIMYALKVEVLTWRDYYGYSLPLDMAKRCQRQFSEKYGSDFMFKVVHEKLVR